MAVIKRANVAPPVLPKETVEVEALGGEVVVQGLLLSDRQDLEAYMVALARAGREAAEGGAGAQAPGMAKVMPRLLHLSGISLAITTSSSCDRSQMTSALTSALRSVSSCSSCWARSACSMWLWTESPATNRPAMSMSRASPACPNSATS